MDRAIAIFLFVFILANLIIQPVIWTQPEQTKIVNVDCFDRYSNKIVNQICEEKLNGISIQFKFFISCITILLSIILNIGFWELINR